MRSKEFKTYGMAKRKCSDRSSELVIKQLQESTQEFSKVVYEKKHRLAELWAEKNTVIPRTKIA